MAFCVPRTVHLRGFKASIDDRAILHNLPTVDCTRKMTETSLQTAKLHYRGAMLSIPSLYGGILPKAHCRERREYTSLWTGGCNSGYLQLVNGCCYIDVERISNRSHDRSCCLSMKTNRPSTSFHPIDRCVSYHKLMLAVVLAQTHQNPNCVGDLRAEKKLLLPFW